MTAAFETLISVRELAQHLNDPQWCIFDCRHDLANPAFGRAAYAEGHIPGAIFLSLDDDLSGRKTGANGRHPLPDPTRFAALMGELGVGNDTQVVAYDDAGGMFAARFWWMLRWLGHHKVALLDGGCQAWSVSQPLSAEIPSPPPAAFRPVVEPLAVDLAYVQRHLDHADMVLVDARSPDRYRGENETLDPIAGHIPGALHRFFRDNLGPDGRFKRAGELRGEFESLLGERDPATVVHHCGSGVTACHNQLAMELAGLAGSRVYAGSWSEWCADASRPMKTGPEP